ncbi:MAG: phosphoenolpyruvate synthase [Chloroflexi bacterium]|nr:MAG: phosphoenolpyruvate synthase [Chloroflexota bacterium]
MSSFVVGFQDVDKSKLLVAGGKGANLGEISKIEGIRVPDGFCISAEAFKRSVGETSSIKELLDNLSLLKVEDRDEIGELSSEIRRSIEGLAIPQDINKEVTSFLSRLGEKNSYAVRSSATAEDLPTASFAGQHDTYLNVVGTEAILRNISKCWASLFTQRAVIYRLQNGLDHRKVHMAVVVQKMVFPQASGILFTADPVTSSRKVLSIDASFGLGEALVSGLVNPDVYKVLDGKIIDRKISTKKLAIYASKDGGTKEQEIEPDRQYAQALTDKQILQVARMGRTIEQHFGCPQDIEWCLVDDDFQIVQSRPITTLFPIPAVDDQENHVYISVGHQQMMTDPMKPLGLSFWQMTTARPMYEAGGRLFVDVVRDLGSPAIRARLVELAGKSDPLIGDALQRILERGDFIPSLPDASPAGALAGGAPAPIETDPAIVTDLIARNQESIAALKRDIRTKSGPALFDFILTDIQELRRILFDRQSHAVFMSAMEATWWLNERLEAWLGEKNAADTLTQSVPHNVTSEMGLALLGVADVIRPHPQVVAFLERVDDDGFLDELPALAGGGEARDAIRGFLDMYGMRCVGEIDITRPRWSERPTTLVPVLLGNIRNFEPGAGAQRFEQGRQEAWAREHEFLERLRTLPDGEQKAEEVKRKIDRVRTFIGYREYPKYGMVSRYFVYKQALLEEAGRLVQAHVLREKEDIFYLRFQELHDVVRTNHADDQLISQRIAAFRSYQALTPPRVLTSDGEVIAGAYRRDDVPAGALVGLPVSAGTIEGRARVILDMAEADLEPGDILVTAYTDPSWTPLFVSIRGLVTEVGGLMTHGAVIAREYGLPTVVGVENATKLIKDGQQIRVHGTEGYVEILSGE